MQLVRFTSEYKKYYNLLTLMISDLDELHGFKPERHSIQELYKNYYYLLFDNSDVVGYIELTPTPHPNTWFIDNVLIIKKYRGKGYGTEAFKVLMKYMEQELNCKIAFIRYEYNNTPARKLYYSF